MREIGSDACRTAFRRIKNATINASAKKSKLPPEMNSPEKMKETWLFEMPDSCLAGKGYLRVRFISDHPLSLMRGVDSLTAFHFFEEGGGEWADGACTFGKCDTAVAPCERLIRRVAGRREGRTGRRHSRVSRAPRGNRRVDTGERRGSK